MAAHIHHYQTNIEWTGNTGQGTRSYTTYSRAFTWQSDGKALIEGSADPPFRGDATKHNPEEMLLAAISSCHMLWYLHLCADNHITVLQYRDLATGRMVAEQPVVLENGETTLRGGHFIQVQLNPVVKLANKQDTDLATALHEQAHARCFIANSVNFPIENHPVFEYPE